MAVRVLVAEDSALLRDGIRRLVDAADDLEVVGTAVDLDSLMAAVAELEPDVVLTDIRMPPTGTDEGIQAADELRRTRPSTGVVVLSQHASPGYAQRLLAGGSAGRAYLLKDRVGDTDDLLAAIRIVAKGGSSIDPHVVEQLVVAANGPSSPLQHLTKREREVLGEMALGKSNAAIAATLVLSERAVEKHINSIFAKLHLNEEADVNRRVRAVLLHLGLT